MPVQAKADNNVPFIGPRARYTVLSTQPVWVYQRMNNASGFTGEAPETSGAGPNVLDPTVSAGLVQWTGLAKGGLFTAFYKTKKAFIIEATDVKAGVTLQIVRAGALSTPTRTFPTSFPAKIAPGEIIKATGGDGTAFAGFLVRLVEEKVW